MGPDRAAGSEHPANLRVNQIPDQPTVSRGSILIIDDSREDAVNLASFLDRLGFKATASRPVNAHDAARSAQPNVILLDLCLDGPMVIDTRSSEHLLRCLKSDETTRRIPVIAMSGVYKNASTEARFRALGADAFYAKREILTIGPFVRGLQARLLMGEAPTPLVAIPPAGSNLDPLDATSDGETETGYQHTILVVDDEPETSELLRVVLRAMNCRVLWADTGAQGLRFAASEVPDLVVLDLNIPGMDGREVCRRLREQERPFTLPILILTGDTRLEQEIACLEMGADDYLIKTTPPLRLQARVRRMLWRHRFQADARGVIRTGEVRLNMKNHRLGLPDGTEIRLTPIESALCALLTSAGGNPVGHKIIFKKLYSAWPELGSEKLRKHVSNIKHKLGRFDGLIESVRGEGYRFNLECARQAASPETHSHDTR